MSGSNHYVAVELDDQLFLLLEKERRSKATIFIPYSNKINKTVHAMVRKFKTRLQVLEMNMAMMNNRLYIARKFIALHGGVLWTSSQLKQVSIHKKQNTLKTPGKDIKLRETFWDEA